MDNQPLCDLTDTRWMEPPRGFCAPEVRFFRNRFACGRPEVLHLQFSADEFAVLFLDGRRIAEGPERGCADFWHYANIDVPLEPGEHVLVARLSVFGPLRQTAQMSVQPGFWAEEAGSSLLSAQWETVALTGCSFFQPQPDWGSAPRVAVGCGYVSGRNAGEGDEWEKVVYRRESRILHPPFLPAMRYDAERNFERRGDLVRFAAYFTGFAEYTFRGVGMVRVRWFESREPDFSTNAKWAGLWEDVYQVNGVLTWQDPWWRAGQSVVIETGENVEAECRFFRTGYPWRWTVDFRDPDPAVTRMLQTARRTLECCTRDTFLDCPHYEQLQYIADSRLEMLASYAVSADRRLPEKALRQLARGQNADGAMRCRFPDWTPCDFQAFSFGRALVIPGFELLYIQMVHDFARLRCKDELVRALLPVLRKIRERMARLRGRDFLLRDLPGWNFLDWLPNWKRGVPPYCENGSGCTLNWLYLRSLRDLADIERHFGRPEYADSALREAERCEEAVIGRFYVPERGAFAEDEGKRYFSEHAQVFALLAAGRREVLPHLEQEDLDPCGIYFSFYFLEACRLYGLRESYERRLAKYRELAARPEVTTFPEEFQHWRSWCHAWSAHSLFFHYQKGTSIVDPIPDGESGQPRHTEGGEKHF